MIKNQTKIAIIGFGEAGAALAAGFGDGILTKSDITAYDIKCGDAATGKREEMHAAGITPAADTSTAIAHSQAIFSVVTADQALDAATAVAATIQPGALFFDCNSCAPSTKVKSAAVINAAGGRYIDVAIMAPIHPRAHKTPMLVASEHGEDAITMMRDMDMDVTLVGEFVGRASTIKMLRSVMIKGIEALSAECFRAACRAGVDEDVAASLNATQSQEGWAEQAAYNLERMTTHGIRRAAEMREVAKTLDDLGVSNAMTMGTIDWQDKFGALGVALDDVDGLQDRIAIIEQTTK